MLKGDGKGNFVPLSIQQSGIFIPGNGRALIALRGAKDELILAASQNKAPLKLFSLNRHAHTLSLAPTDLFAVIKYKDGTTEKRELYYGHSFLSQSARFIKISEVVSSVEIIDNKGNHRLFQF